MHWFTVGWWRYLLAPITGYAGRLETTVCRMTGHPEGVVWWNPGGSEPDMHCIKCGDYLG